MGFLGVLRGELAKNPKKQMLHTLSALFHSFKMSEGEGGKGKRERVVQGDDEMHSTVILVEQYLRQKNPFGQKQLRKVSSAEGRWDIVFLAV